MTTFCLLVGGCDVVIELPLCCNMPREGLKSTSFDQSMRDKTPPQQHGVLLGASLNIMLMVNLALCSCSLLSPLAVVLLSGSCANYFGIEEASRFEVRAAL